jgi:hypothetical protein
MENCRIQKCTICGSGEPNMYTIRLFANDVAHPLHHHFWAAASQYYQASFYTDYVSLPVTSVDHVVNHALRAKFEAKQQQFSRQGIDATPRLLFHGTNEANINYILHNNFRLKYVRRAVHGFGFYFTELPEMALSFCTTRRCILLCMVLLGQDGVNSKCILDRMGARSSRSFVVGQTLGVRDECTMDQILPVDVINFG